MKFLSVSVTLVALAMPAMAVAVDFESIPEEMSRQLSEKLSAEAGKLENLKFKIEADVEKGNGIHIPKKAGALIVPLKGLKEGEELSAKFKLEAGAPLAYLFLHHMVPLVEGKPVAADRLPSVKFTDSEGTDHTVHVVLLSARQLTDDDYRLYVFGRDAKTLVDAKFSEGSGPAATPVGLEVKDLNASSRSGQMVVTVFGKYQASFEAAYTGE